TAATIRLFVLGVGGTVEAGVVPLGGAGWELVPGEDFAAVQTSAGVHRVDLEGGAMTEISTAPSARPHLEVFQGRWIVHQTDAGVVAMRADGSDRWTVAEGGSLAVHDVRETTRLAHV